MIQVRPNARAAMTASALAKAANLVYQHGGKAVQAGRNLRKYFNGDVNQPASASTVQRAATIRPVRARNPRRADGSRIVEKGTVKLGDIVTSATAADITVNKSVFSKPLELLTLGGRLHAMGTLYSRWKFIRAVLRYVPVVGSTTDGGLTAFYSQDPDEYYDAAEVVDSPSSNIDNMEFCVREKASMQLHLPTTLLYAAQGQGDKTWHSAGVVNVCSSGSLAVSKAYGALWIDFVIEFDQPCNPFDPYGPAFRTASTQMAPSGSAASGTPGPIFNFVNDFSKLAADSGRAWFQAPYTGGFIPGGAINIPAYSTVYVQCSINDTAAVAADITVAVSAGVVASGGAFYHSTDWTEKNVFATYTNTSAGWGTVTLNAGACTIPTATICVARLPYRL